jgi:GT2 family glycosyltransferase
MEVTERPTSTPSIAMSVIVPTFERPAVLARCLDHLAAQEGTRDFEVIVMIDGESDYGDADLDRRAREFPVPLTWHQLPHRGHSAAMNRALRLARAPRVLIIGDDIFASPGMVARHLARLRELDDPRAAVQGKVVWHPDMLPDPFLEWDARAGVLFAFGSLPERAFVPARYLYTSNVSFDRAFVLEAGGFNETIPRWVDTEFAYRAEKRGLRLYYDPDAWGWHFDRWSVEREGRRQQLKGTLAARLVVEHPDFAEFVTMPRLDAWREVRYRASRAARPVVERLRAQRAAEWCWTHELHYRFARGFADESARLRGAPVPRETAMPESAASPERGA